MKFDLNSKHGSATITTLLVIGIVVVVNYLVGGLGLGNFRVDFTQDHLYTLSQGTRNIINSIKADKPVTLRIYASTEDRVMPAQLQTYARAVEDLLTEFQKVSDGKIVIEKLAPNPDTEDEDKAREDEIRGMQVNTEGENLYLGLAVQSAQQKEVLPFLNPKEETLLEYQVARAVSKVTKTSKPVIGVMSSMPIMGSQDPMAQMQGKQGPPPWFAIEQLKMDYDVREVASTADKIDNDVTVLIVYHPAAVEESTEFAIDQFVMRGGSVIAFVDPKSWLAEAISGQAAQNPMMGRNPNTINPQSTLKKLFDAWGIGFDTDKIVADKGYPTPFQGRVNPTALTLPNAAFNHDDRLTKDLQTVFMLSAGSFSITPKEGLQAIPLISSSENAQMIPTAEAEKLRTQNLTNFVPEGRKLALAVRLQGKFQTAFPNGPPLKKGSGVKLPGEGGGAQTDTTAPATTPAPATAAAPAPTTPTMTPAVPLTPAKPKAPPASIAAPPAAISAAPASAALPGSTVPGLMPPPASAAAPAANFLKESKPGKGGVILFADADMLYHEFYLNREPMTGMMVETASNLSLFLGAVELLSGGGDLISVRNRATTTRPFTTMDNKKSAVEAEFSPKMKELNAQLTSAQEKLTNLRGSIDKKSGRVILPPQAQADIAKWQETQVDINRQIREIKKQQRKAIDWEETKLTLLNMVGMPLLVICAGLILALRRRSSTAAK
ncbi:MAG: ABC-type uncharacterized transport system involved in gliding motility, auxiliary component [Verrucomicrobiaceae bacterium]|nr:ABC-type uncharacterized transport system involved in gliding motility, auxiliary component [Verrucomicrobiaceae bacterium]